MDNSYGILKEKVVIRYSVLALIRLNGMWFRSIKVPVSKFSNELLLASKLSFFLPVTSILFHLASYYWVINDMNVNIKLS